MHRLGQRDQDLRALLVAVELSGLAVAGQQRRAQLADRSRPILGGQAQQCLPHAGDRFGGEPVADPVHLLDTDGGGAHRDPAREEGLAQLGVPLLSRGPRHREQLPAAAGPQRRRPPHNPAGVGPGHRRGGLTSLDRLGQDRDPGCLDGPAEVVELAEQWAQLLAAALPQDRIDPGQRRDRRRDVVAALGQLLHLLHPANLDASTDSPRKPGPREQHRPQSLFTQSHHPQGRQHA